MIGRARISSDGRLLAIDELGAQLIGCRDAAEALGRTELQALESARTWLASPTRDGKPEHLEQAWADSAGQERRIRLTISPQWPADGAPAWFDLLIDEAPAADRHLLGSLLESLSLPVFVKDEQHRWVILNDAYCRFMGYPREELLGKSDYQFFPKAEADVFWAKDDLLFERGGINDNEESFTDKAGKPHVILTRKTLHVDRSGRRYIVGVITDITERKQMENELRESHQQLELRVVQRTAELTFANHQLELDIIERRQVEAELRRSEERFRQLADSMPQLVWTCGPDGKLDYINVKWREYTGRNPGDADWNGALHPDDRERIAAAWAAAIREKRAFDVEYRLEHPQGGYRWHLGRALPVRDGDGNVVRWYGTSTEIEDQKRYQERLQDEDRRKDEFLAMLGHELRNPLTPIRTAVYLMKKLGDGRGGPLERAQQIIERQVSHMARLIDDLLDVSRIARGKIALQEHPVDLVQLVRATAEDRAEAAHARGISLSTDLPASPVRMRGDPARLAQVLGNLLDNAEKFTEPGGHVRLELSCDGQAGRARLAVKDTGIGMAPETLSRVFEPFVQAQSARRGRSGLGLGLSLVKGLVELHGGSVRVSSAGLGKGSEFVIELPLLETPACCEPHRSAIRFESGPAQRVLVVEDNVDAAESLRLVLEAAGHEVAVAHTAEEGIALALRFLPHIVLSDIGLPGMSGYDLARRLRAEPSMRAAHLVAVTGYGQEADRRRALDAGFEAHLIKPFDNEGLNRLLAEFAGDAATAG